MGGEVITLLMFTVQAKLLMEPSPSPGQETIISVIKEDLPVRGETVRVIYHPRSAHEQERAVGITDARGRVSWTPEVGGQAILRVGNTDHRVRLPWSNTPFDTIVLVVLLLLAPLGLCISGARKKKAPAGWRR